MKILKKTHSTSYAIGLLVGIVVSLSISGCAKKDKGTADLKKGLHVVDGKYLADDCGNKVLLRGINMGNIYAARFGQNELEEIAKTGANSVRLVLTREYQDWTNGGAMTALSAAALEGMISSCISKGMIPILELHDFTGTANVLAELPRAVAWWTKPEISTLLFRYQKSIILNIANEPDNGTAHASSYKTANVIAVKGLRDAGYTCPIMIDAPDWGKNHVFFLENGNSMMDADPLRNLIFSVHAYWPANGAFGNYPDSWLNTAMNNLANSGLPIVIGELARADIQNNIAYQINYNLLMSRCQTQGIGYLVWWWGFYENPGANNQLSMTNDGLFSGLQGAGKAMAVTDANSIQKTAVKACRL